MTGNTGPLNTRAFSVFMQKFKKQQCPREAKEVCPQLLGCVFWDVAVDSRLWLLVGAMSLVALHPGPTGSSPENLGLVVAWQQARLPPASAGWGPVSDTSSAVPAEPPFVVLAPSPSRKSPRRHPSISSVRR